MEYGLPERLVWHGAVVILVGMLVGFVYGMVVTGDITGSERAWRMAHLEGVLNGLLLLAVAGIADRLALTPRRAAILAWALVVTAWGNMIGSIVGATLGVRGLAPGGSLANTVVYLSFVAGVIAVLIALVLLAFGARQAQREG